MKAKLLFGLCLMINLGVMAQKSGNITQPHYRGEEFGKTCAITPNTQKAKMERVAILKSATPNREVTEDAEEYVMDYGYCYEPYQLSSLGSGRNYAAILLTTDDLIQYAGCRVTEIGVVTGYNTEDEKNHIEEVTVFLTTSLESEPIVQSTGHLESEPGGWNYIKLDEPFEIDGKEGIYVGYYFDAPTDDDLGLVFDGSYSWSGLGNLVAIGNDYDELDWQCADDNLGALCIRARLEGSNLPHDRLNITWQQFPSYVIPGEPFDGKVWVSNSGLNEITSVDVCVTIGNQEPITQTILLDSPLGYNGYGSFSIENLICNQEGNNIPFKVEVTKLNGNRDNLGYATSYEYTFLCLAEGFQRNLLCEEGTGTWCGYCPRGIAAFEYMKERYSNGTFIPVAIHMSSAISDPMDVVGAMTPDATIEEFCYLPMMYHFYAVPAAYINRVYNGNASINLEPTAVEEEYLKQVKVPSFVQITGECSMENKTGGTVKLSTSVEFVTQENNADYSIGFIIVEDNVGPYMQTNYYADGANGPMYGWEDKPQYTEWIYDNVARNGSRPYGLENSVPSEIKAGETYTYETDVDLSSVNDVNNCKIIVLVINNKTEAVENASYVSNFGASVGIESNIKETQKTIWYNLQGIKLDSPIKGQPIIKQTGNKIEKVILN